MKKHGILNSEISKILTDLGHTDSICIADCGLPVPTGVKKIDLAVKFGTPSLLEILEVVSNDMIIEEIILAEEIKIHNKGLHNQLIKSLSGVKISYITHEEFKQATLDNKAIIRTGENTSYANVILKAGVNFGGVT